MRLLLVDGNNLLMRALMATEKSDMSSYGTSTGPLLVFINTLTRHIREESPTHVAVAWDGPGARRRLLIDPEYKANRVSMPTDSDQELQTRKSDAFDMAQTFCAVAGIMQVRRQGYEADDIIAQYWNQYSSGADVVILSSDKDYMQLLTDGTIQIRLSSSSAPTDRWDEQRAKDYFGCPIEWIPSVMALMGDAGDNVIGLKGIGPKTAVKLLKNVNGVLNHIDDKRVKDQWGRVATNLKLVDLRTPTMQALPDLPSFKPTKLVGYALSEEFVQFLSIFELNSILKRVYANNLWDDSVR